jgi:hypothetical protein
VADAKMRVSSLIRRKRTGIDLYNTGNQKEVLRCMKFILSACPIHQGCTIQVVFGKTSGRRAPWPDPDLKPIGEREFPGLVLIEAEHLRNQRSAVANQNLDRLGRWLLRLHLHE